MTSFRSKEDKPEIRSGGLSGATVEPCSLHGPNPGFIFVQGLLVSLTSLVFEPCAAPKPMTLDLPGQMPQLLLVNRNQDLKLPNLKPKYCNAQPHSCNPKSFSADPKTRTHSNSKATSPAFRPKPRSACCAVWLAGLRSHTCPL